MCMHVSLKKKIKMLNFQCVFVFCVGAVPRGVHGKRPSVAVQAQRLRTGL